MSRLITEYGLDISAINGTGPNGRITKDDVAAASAMATRKSAIGSALASSLARRLMREHGIDPTSMRGNGVRRRVTRRDVEFVLSENRPSFEIRCGDEKIPFSRVRRVNAERVDAVRCRYGVAFNEGEAFSLTYLAFISTAVLGAFREFPYLIAPVGTDELGVHHDLSLGIAVDVDSCYGLLSLRESRARGEGPIARLFTLRDHNIRERGASNYEM